MAKKKVKQQKQAPLSPAKYMKTRVRNLPIEKCYVNPNWQETGLTYVMVVRRHTQGTHSFGVFLVDTWCRGVVDCFYDVNVDDDRINEIVEWLDSKMGVEEADYALAHNLVYGAVDFADEAGIEPHKDFDVAQYILEDEDDAPYMDIEFGRNGRYCLSMPDWENVGYYIAQLDENIGRGKYDCLLDFPQSKSPFNKGVEGKYGYLRGERPNADISSVRNKDLLDVLSTDISRLEDDRVRDILSGDADELRNDLHTIVIATIHDTWRDIEEDNDRLDNLGYEMIPNAMLFLAQVADESSTEVVLEVFRQSDEFIDFYFGDAQVEFMAPVIYRLFCKDFTKFYDFMIERGPSQYAKSSLIEALANQVMTYAPERAGELEKLFSDLFDFYMENRNDEYIWDGSLVGLIISKALDCGFTGLLPKISEMYRTGYVDESICGSLSDIEKDIMDRYDDDFSAYPLDIFEWKTEFKRRWDHCRDNI